MMESSQGRACVAPAKPWTDTIPGDPRHQGEPARGYEGDRDLGPLVGLHPSPATPPPDLLGAPRKRLCERIFWGWEVYQHAHDRRELQLQARALQREFKPIIRCYAGKSPRYKCCRGMARNLLRGRRATRARLPSAHTPCRLQRRPLHAYLADAIAAHNRGDPVPLLI
jgi:hypothetical protein